MNPDEIKKWLEPEEWKIYEELQKIGERNALSPFWKPALAAFERLAACRKRSEQRRVLMEKHQWGEMIDCNNHRHYRCLECGGLKEKSDCDWVRDYIVGHTDTCLWAKAIEKGE